MFTGLVTAIGTVTKARATARGRRLTIRAPYRGLAVGESVAVNGTCLTVVARRRGSFDVEAVAATRSRTTIGDWHAGTRVNLERALRLGDRLGGHLVAGHVDGVGTVLARLAEGDGVLLDVRLPADVASVTVPRGSLAVDGVSLTVAALPRRGVARLALIPHTLSATTLVGARPGDRVHLEADQIGKLVRQLLLPHRARRRRT